MLGLISALVLAAAPPATAESAALPAGPWWEKFTVVLAGDKPRSCTYESNRHPVGDADCATVADDAGSSASSASTGAAELTRVTFERRFIPGLVQQAEAPLEVGETVLGQRLLALAIDSAGKVTGCKVIATSGDAPPAYSCDDASTERFAAAGNRQGLMMVRVYGHSEHLV
jgi:hypothetical protein